MQQKGGAYEARDELPRTTANDDRREARGGISETGMYSGDSMEANGAEVGAGGRRVGGYTAREQVVGEYDDKRERREKHAGAVDVVKLLRDRWEANGKEEVAGGGPVDNARPQRVASGHDECSS